MIKTAKNWFVFLLLSIIVLPNQYSTVCFSRETEAEYGELKIEGTGIKRLVLKRKVGGNETINEPNEVIKLLAGEYSLLESHLENGYIRLGTAIDKWFIVSQDKQAILKVGAPLKQKINAQRQGKFLVLSYELAGLGGDIYTDSTRTKKPAFSIYKGDILVTSGNFEFG